MNWWRLLFLKSKLSLQCKVKLNSIFEDISCTCRATFEDIAIPEELTSVCVCIHKCFDPIEKVVGSLTSYVFIIARHYHHQEHN